MNLFVSPRSNKKNQCVRELPGRACLEIDLAIGIRYSRVEMRADSLWALRVCPWGVCERMRGARVSLVCGHMERVRDPRAWACACTCEVFTILKHIAVDS